MRHCIFGLLTCAVLAGCATHPHGYGNFTTSVPTEANERFVSDTLRQLTAMHPPARTQLNLQQAATDAYGSGLVDALRAKGYAVLEFKPAAAGTFWRANLPAAFPIGAGGISLRYVLDQPGASDFYRLALTIGDRTLTRAYLAQNNTALPAGAWLRKE